MEKEYISTPNMTNKEAANIINELLKGTLHIGSRRVQWALARVITLLNDCPDKDELLAPGDFVSILKTSFCDDCYKRLIEALQQDRPVYISGVPCSGKTLITRTLREAGFTIAEAGDFSEGPEYTPSPDTLINWLMALNMSGVIRPYEKSKVLQKSFIEKTPVYLNTYGKYVGTCGYLDFSPIAYDIRNAILELCFVD